MLTAAQKEQWLKDLRSGEFKQGRNRLHKASTDEYCCLGVLAQAIAEDVRFELHVDRYEYKFSIDPFYYGGLVPQEVIGQHCVGSLMRMNDNQHSTFNEIADWIEINVVTSG